MTPKKEPAPKGAPNLKQLSATADKWWQTREKRLALEKQVEALQKEESELKNFLIDNISKNDSTGVSGKLVRVTVDTEDQPTVEDVDKFRAYIQKTKRFDLAQALKPAAAAVKEMWESGKQVPGIGKFKVVKLKYNKVK